MKKGEERTRSMQIILAALSKDAELVYPAVELNNTGFLPVEVEANW